MICVLLQDAHAIPAPIDSMMLNQTVAKLHDFDKIHLLAIGCAARVLPHHFVSICEKSSAVITPHRGLTLRQNAEKSAQLCLAAANATVGAHQMRNERTFEGGIRRIQSKKSFGIIAG